MNKNQGPHAARYRPGKGANGRGLRAGPGSPVLHVRPAHPRGGGALTSTDLARAQLARVVELFSSEDLTTSIEKLYLEGDGTRPSRKWTFSNRMLMMVQGTMDARGYRQWQQAGRHVKRGSKAIYILGPVTRKVRDADDPDKDGVVVVGFRGIPVFRYEDTDGEPLNEVRGAPRGMPPLHGVAEGWGMTVRYDESEDGEYGSFSQKGNEIRLCTDDVAVFFHELAHKAHSRFERLKGGQDPEQEAIAQLSACVLARMYGYDDDAFSYTYIKQYAEARTPEQVGRFCYKVLNKVERVLDMILGEDGAGGGGGPGTAGAEGAAPEAAP
ncbi:hypothetical protein CENSYa_0743 [Cenarchaeum symbiosum A]|uniref:Antirestriction protein n=1 Tax=Cenarchaeum symbiosum (strain A) TaxID=414004 RepID=A0RVK9_CENSY|nr:hypothetical protein CENSYa_0743 [Cenarchaeum symbiosum A]